MSEQIKKDLPQTGISSGIHWSILESVEKCPGISDFPLDDRDIIVASYGKSGTAWLQQIISLLLPEFTKNEDETLDQKFSFLEFSVLIPQAKLPTPEEIAKRPSPRLIKTHLPYRLLPTAVQNGNARILYIARNVKDVCVSLYYFARSLRPMNYQGPFGEFFDVFVSGKYMFGSWLDNVAEFWAHRDDHNVLFLFYEDLHKNRLEVVHRIATFLGRAVTEQQLSDIFQRTSFDVMKDDDTANYSWHAKSGLQDSSIAKFMRKGIIGDWQNYLTPEMEKKVEECCLEPLRQQGLHFVDRIN